MDKEIEDVIKNIDEKKEDKVDWTNAWGKKISSFINVS